VRFKEKMKTDELISSIESNILILNNNDINLGLLKTRIKHIWDYVGCCNDCMLIIDKLCSNLELGESGRIKTKVNLSESLNKFEEVDLLKELDIQISKLDNLKV